MSPPKKRSDLELKDRHNKWIVRLKSDVDPKSRKSYEKSLEDEQEGYKRFEMDTDLYDDKDPNLDNLLVKEDTPSPAEKQHSDTPKEIIKESKIVNDPETKKKKVSKRDVNQPNKYQLIPLTALLGKQCHCQRSQTDNLNVVNPTENNYDNKKETSKRKGVNIQLGNKGLVQICPKSESGAPAGTSVTIDLARPMTYITKPKVETESENQTNDARKEMSSPADSHQNSLRGGPSGYNYGMQGQGRYQNYGRQLHEERCMYPSGQMYGYYGTTPPYYGTMYRGGPRPSFATPFPNFRTAAGIPPSYGRGISFPGYGYYGTSPRPQIMQRNTPPSLQNYLPGFQIPPHIRQMFDEPTLYPPSNPSRRC